MPLPFAALRRNSKSPKKVQQISDKQQGEDSIQQTTSTSSPPDPPPPLEKPMVRTSSSSSSSGQISSAAPESVTSGDCDDSTIVGATSADAIIAPLPIAKHVSAHVKEEKVELSDFEVGGVAVHFRNRLN
jgi:hypothetical protein